MWQYAILGFCREGIIQSAVAVGNQGIRVTMLCATPERAPRDTRTLPTQGYRHSQ